MLAGRQQNGHRRRRFQSFKEERTKIGINSRQRKRIIALRSFHDHPLDEKCSYSLWLSANIIAAAAAAATKTHCILLPFGAGWRVDLAAGTLIKLSNCLRKLKLIHAPQGSRGEQQQQQQQCCFPQTTTTTTQNKLVRQPANSNSFVRVLPY